MDQTRIQSLIVLVLSGEAGDEERRQLEAWRQASAENDRLYREYESIWRQAADVPRASAPNIDAEWQALASRLELSGARKPAGTAALRPSAAAWLPRRWPARALAMAATVLLFLAGTLYMLYFSRGGRLFETRPGEQRTVTLADGSIVKLNAESRLEWVSEAADTLRLVRLQGEAFFEVKKDGRAFVVATANSNVRVLGTVFDVWARRQQTRVIVKEGRVEVSAAGDRVEVQANHMATVAAEPGPISLAAVDAVRRLGWLEGKIVFEQTTLAEAAAELQRQYNIHIRIDDPRIAELTLTGVFEKKPIENILQSICLALQLQLSRRNGTYLLDY